MKIGPFTLAAPLALAPMAGVTDLPFRRLCRQMGAGVAASEMVTSDVRLWNTSKSRHRLDHRGEPEPRVVQIAGYDPEMMAGAARMNVELGAQVIDINFGCPAKKVCNRAAGSALMRDEVLVRRILAAVVAAAGVPVTLKTRTGWDRENRNAVSIARMAEQEGIAAIAVHGRTREDFFQGVAEYETAAAVKRSVRIPVFVNGDIDCAAKALKALEQSGADGVMIGRAAQGRPWIFRELRAGLANTVAAPPLLEEVRGIMISHLEALYSFYGEIKGVRVARKHLGWYCRLHPEVGHLPAGLLTTECAREQLSLTSEFLISRIRGTIGNDREEIPPDQWARPRHSASRPYRAGALHVFPQPEWPSSRPALRSGDARGRIAAVPGGHGLRGRQPEPGSDHPRHQSRHIAQEIARIRARFLS
jgi:tRNA-dihydrouridine synthase B